MFTQSAQKTTSQYAKELVAKSLWWKDVYKEHALKGILIKELDKSIRQSIRGHLASGQLASLRNLAFPATSLLIFRGGHQWIANGQVSVKRQSQRQEWQSRGQPVEVLTSSKTESTSIGQETGSESK